MKRIATFSIDAVHEMVRGEVTSILVRGIPVKVTSRRLRMFATKGVQCVSCHKVGIFYTAESRMGITGYHLNLYTNCGTLMTQDHIIPIARGGKNHMENLQPMCSRCNNHKGSKTECESSS